MIPNLTSILGISALTIGAFNTSNHTQNVTAYPSATPKPTPTPTQSITPTPSISPSGTPSSNPSSTPSTIPSTTPSTTPSGVPSPGLSPSASGTPSVGASSTSTIVLQTATSTLGTYLTDGQGRSLYLFQSDTPNNSTCNDACAQVWPPLIVSNGQTPQAAGGALGNLINTLTRNDGSTQVTYNGWPLYYYSLDQTPGDTHGEGVNGFGAFWYLIQPNGNPLISSATPSASASPIASPSGTSNPNS